MDWGTEAVIFLTYSAGILGIYFFGKWLLWPLKKIAKLLLNSILGGAALIILHFVCINFGIFVPVNAVTALMAGLLGMPGIVGIIVFFNI